MKKNIQVVDVSHRKNEPKGYLSLREKGQDAILFLHFLTPATLVVDGKAISVTRNACIIYTPGVRQEYGATSEAVGFQNNFVTFRADTIAFFANFNLPLNQPFYIQNEAAITERVEWIAWASANRLQPLDDEITENVYALFGDVESGLLEPGPKNQRDNQTRQRFIALRGEIMLNPKGWSVEKMAATCWLTRCRFYVLYKSFFGTTPSADLATSTLSYAKDRLLNTTDPIAEIAIDCGYARVESFIRMFNEREGMTPGQYRRVHAS